MHPQLTLNLFEYSIAAAWVVLGAVVVLLALPAGLRLLRRLEPDAPAEPIMTPAVSSGSATP